MESYPRYYGDQVNLLTLGQEFAGRYRVERFLAAGGMGAVYVAEQLATERRVALKVLFPQVLASEDAVQRFQIEAKIAARVRSENIVQVLDAGFDPETRTPFLVMELLEGQPLEDLVEGSGPVSPALTVTYLTQTAAGLDKAHFHRTKSGAVQPIVHRDLKPENLFLTHRENGEPVIKILDFGIAKVLSDTAHLSQEIKGTPLYMAFEQASGKQITPQTDIWALGLIAFYLLTGKSYWRAASNPIAGLPALFAEVLSEPIAPASERATELGVPHCWGAEFDSWLDRCLRRNAGERFETAGAAAAALTAALGFTSASSTARSPKANPETQRSEVLDAPGKGAFADPKARAALGDSATIAVSATDQSLTFSHAGIPESKSRWPLVAVAVLSVLGGAAFAGYKLLANHSQGAGALPAGTTEADEQEGSASAQAVSEVAATRAVQDATQLNVAPAPSVAPAERPSSEIPAAATGHAPATVAAPRARRAANPGKPAARTKAPAPPRPVSPAAPPSKKTDLWDDR